jgi:hypothetical protein
LSRGVVASPPTFDPAKALSRGEFMKVVAHGLKVPNINDSSEAFGYFKRLGVVDVVANEFPEMAVDDDLISPISLEAGQKFVTVAKKAVISQAKAHHSKGLFKGNPFRANPFNANQGKQTPAGSSSSSYLSMNRPTRVERLFVAPVYAAGETKLLSPTDVKYSGKQHHINYLDAAQLFEDLNQ